MDNKSDGRSTHQQNVDAVKRRGHLNRVTAKLRYWNELKNTGYELEKADEAEINLLKIMLAEVVKGMEAGGQPVGTEP